jgi:hypothetical protein
MCRRHQSKGTSMSVPSNDDTRESYVDRMTAMHLGLAKRHHAHRQGRSMWLHLFTWVQCEEIYGEHWDDLKTRGKI